MSEIQTDYDSVVYPSALYPQTHPDRLATNAILFGLEPADIGRARVLELGCGDGTNVIAMAESLPESEFIGIDLAGSPVRKGQQLIQALGLENVHLHHLDVLKTPQDIGKFDYFIAHGLYSWVPESVREKILSLCEHHLNEQGIAYVSYNAYPGAHLRDLVRHMMRFHTQHFPDPQEKIRQARALIKFASEAKQKPTLWQNILSQQLERIRQYTDSGFYHDDLGEINQPFYFHEFMEAADGHGLQFLSEADLPEMVPDVFSEAARTLLHEMEGQDVIRREQYLDFVRGRSFRQTLLCRKGLKVEREVGPENVFRLLVAGEVSPVDPTLDVTRADPADFHGTKGAVIATSHPVAKAALVHLGTVFPRHVSFDELIERARERCGRKDSAETLARDRIDSAEFLARCALIGFLELHARVPAFTTQVSERPAVSRLVRLQLEHSDVIATRRHRPYRVEGALARALLLSLDGAHDRAALLQMLEGVVRSAADGKKQATETAIAELPGQLEDQLKRLATAGLLTA